MEKPTILIVDDNEDLRESIAELLKDEGFETHCCEDGAVALGYLRSTPRLPSLIVLDLMMPVMNGWAFREQQLQDAALSAIPVVGMTANRGAPPLSGVETLLLKPFRITDLLQVIQAFLARDNAAASQ